MYPKEWYTEAMLQKVYVDPVQEGLKIVISGAMVKTFNLLNFKYNNVTKKYVPELPLTHDSCIQEVIDYVILYLFVSYDFYRTLWFLFCIVCDY